MRAFVQSKDLKSETVYKSTILSIQVISPMMNVVSDVLMAETTVWGVPAVIK
jgi:hypothetical protein